MAFYEREFIEIKRDNYKMKIVGPLKCSVEQEDVRQYIMACVRKEKIAIAMRVVLVVILWLFAALPLLGEFVLSSNPNPHIGPGMIALTIVFALAAVAFFIAYFYMTGQFKEYNLFFGIFAKPLIDILAGALSVF